MYFQIRVKLTNPETTALCVRPRPRRQLGDGAGGGEMTITMRNLGQSTHTFIFDDSKGVWTIMFLSIGPFGALTGLKDAFIMFVHFVCYVLYMHEIGRFGARTGMWRTIAHMQTMCGNERTRFGVKVSIKGFVLPQLLIFLMASSHLFVNGYVCVAKNIVWYFHRPFNMGANSCKSLRGKACFLNSLLENAGFCWIPCGNPCGIFCRFIHLYSFPRVACFSRAWPCPRNTFCGCGLVGDTD